MLLSVLTLSFDQERNLWTQQNEWRELYLYEELVLYYLFYDIKCFVYVTYWIYEMILKSIFNMKVKDFVKYLKLDTVSMSDTGWS